MKKYSDDELQMMTFTDVINSRSKETINNVEFINEEAEKRAKIAVTKKAPLLLRIVTIAIAPVFLMLAGLVIGLGLSLCESWDLIRGK